MSEIDVLAMDREILFEQLCMLLGEPTRQNARAPYVSVFWERHHLTVTIWEDGKASLFQGGDYEQILEAAAHLRRAERVEIEL